MSAMIQYGAATRFAAVAVVTACLAGRSAVAADPEAWQIATGPAAAAQALADYRNNIVRARWAGDAKGLAAAYPANVSCFLPIAGTEQSVSNVQRILDATVAAIPQKTRGSLLAKRRLVPIVEWLVWTTRPGVTNEAAYLSPRNFAPVFTESDFNEGALTNSAVRLSSDLEPPIVSLEWSGEYKGATKMTAAEPVLDYPDFHPETLFAAPHVRAMVLRAPEARREFRVRATTQYDASVPVVYKWFWSTWPVSVGNWRGPESRQKESGYGHVSVDRSGLRGRVDIMVMARRRGSFWGPPSIISFYADPAERRVYAKDRLLDSVSFDVKYRRPVPYSFASISLPYDWVDSYQYGVNRRLLGYERRYPLSLQEERFSACGERVIESHSNETPKTSRRVRYFERGGKLAYEDEGNEIHYKFSDFKPRR